MRSYDSRARGDGDFFTRQLLCPASSSHSSGLLGLAPGGCRTKGGSGHRHKLERHTTRAYFYSQLSQCPPPSVLLFVVARPHLVDQRRGAVLSLLAELVLLLAQKVCPSLGCDPHILRSRSTRSGLPFVSFSSRLGQPYQRQPHRHFDGWMCICLPLGLSRLGDSDQEDPLLASAVSGLFVYLHCRPGSRASLGARLTSEYDSPIIPSHDPNDCDRSAVAYPGRGKAWRSFSRSESPCCNAHREALLQPLHLAATFPAGRCGNWSSLSHLASRRDLFCGLLLLQVS